MPWKIGLIGTGNLASFFAREISKDQGNQLYVKGSNEAKTASFCTVYSCEALQENRLVDFYLITVQNDAIDQVIAGLPKHLPIFIGAGFHRCPSEQVAYLYPLQSIHMNRMPPIQEVPFLIDAQKNNYVLGERFLASIGARYQHVTTEQRLRSHLAAVFINNFGYFILKAGLNIGSRELSPEWFHPLLKTTSANALLVSDLQTGPARRNDLAMMEEQRRMLEEFHPEWAALYDDISQLILRKYHEL